MLLAAVSLDVVDRFRALGIKTCSLYVAFADSVLREVMRDMFGSNDLKVWHIVGKATVARSRSMTPRVHTLLPSSFLLERAETGCVSSSGTVTPF